MLKTTFIALFGLTLAGAALLTAFSTKSGFRNDPEISFEEFLQQFPAQQLPYALDENSLKVRLDHYVAQVNHPSSEQYNVQPKRLDWKYFQFLPNLAIEAGFSRVPMMAEPVALFAAADNVAVMYSTSRSFRTGYASFYLAVFDRAGHQISSNLVGQVLPGTIMSSTISTSLQAELKTWRIDWKKNYDKHGMEGNKINGLVHIDTQSLDLNKPTPKESSLFDKKLIAPPVIEELSQKVEEAKSK